VIASKMSADDQHSSSSLHSSASSFYDSDDQGRFKDNDSGEYVSLLSLDPSLSVVAKQFKQAEPSGNETGAPYGRQDFVAHREYVSLEELNALMAAVELQEKAADAAAATPAAAPFPAAAANQ
ncbi:hypothetical protein PFISCL1PPCAC_7602, partial [Pristionchus fissidentatus]